MQTVGAATYCAGMASTPILPLASEPAPSPAALRRALRRVRAGVALDVTEAAVLLAARGEQLDALLDAAGRVRDAGLRDAGRPGVVTYSRKVFVPLTRLCRDRCHYCTFATVPHRLPAAFLERDEVLEIARAGAAAGCKEALFTLGDRPEERWPAAREWLEARGYHSTLEYVRACAIAVRPCSANSTPFHCLVKRRRDSRRSPSDGSPRMTVSRSTPFTTTKCL